MRHVPISLTSCIRITGPGRYQSIRSWRDRCAFADEMRGVSMWETYRGPLIFVGIVVVVAMLIAAF